MYSPATQHDGNDATDKIPQHGPIAQGSILPVVYLHAYSRKHVDKHGTGIEYHQQQEEQNSHPNGAQLENIHQEIGRILSFLHINKHGCKAYGTHRSPADRRVIIPVEYFSIHQYIHYRSAHQAKYHHTAEFTKGNGKTTGGILMIRHGNKYHQNRKQQCSHHEIIHILPFILIGQPCGK